MGYFLLTCTIFAIATGINSISVYVQKRFRFYNRWRNSWLLHSLVILPFWAIFMYLLLNLNNHYILHFHALPAAGYVLLILATLMFGLAIHEIGLRSLLNGNWFGRVKILHGDIFNLLKNPIYDSYLLAFIGVGLADGNAAYLILALEGYIGLNLIESRIEQIEEEK